MYLRYGRRCYIDPTPNTPALAVDQISVSHPGSPTPVLQNVSLQVPRGARAALVGPNGSGKSTLLKAIAGLLPLQAGTIAIYGKPPGACHHRVAYLPQRGEIDWRFPISVRRLVLAGRYPHLGWLRRPQTSDWQLVDAVLERLDISQLAERQIGELSGGQQQRALLARALVQGANLLLLDEPLTAVDVGTRQLIAQVLDAERQQGTTALVATHHVDRVEDEFDCIVALQEGQRVAYEPAMALQPMLEQTLMLH